MVMITPTPEGQVQGSLSETGQGLQLSEEDCFPSQLSILNLTISLQLILSHKQARSPSLEQAILLMISPPKQAIHLILSTLLYITQLRATVQLPKSSLKLLQYHQTSQAHLLVGEPWILPGQRVIVIVENMCSLCLSSSASYPLTSESPAPVQ